MVKAKNKKRNKGGRKKGKKKGRSRRITNTVVIVVSTAKQIQTNKSTQQEEEGN